MGRGGATNMGPIIRGLMVFADGYDSKVIRTFKRKQCKTFSFYTSNIFSPNAMA